MQKLEQVECDLNKEKNKLCDAKRILFLASRAFQEVCALELMEQILSEVRLVSY